MYADYTTSERYASALAAIRAVDASVASLINKHGIGEQLLPNGEYDHESGQLLAEMPERERKQCVDSNAYEQVIDLANDYADFCDRS